MIRTSASEWLVGLLSVHKFCICYYPTINTEEPVIKNVEKFHEQSGGFNGTQGIEQNGLNAALN